MAAKTMTETKKMMNNPRVEIDTSPPFESVKEAVHLFGGSGPWIPHNHHLLPLADDHDHHNAEAFTVDKMEEHTARLERVLITRERETLNVLRELEEAKKLIQDLKVKSIQDGSTFTATTNITPESYSSAPTEKLDRMLNIMDFDQARMNLNRTTIDLAVIRASVESLNTKIRKESSDESKVSNSPVVYSTVKNHKTYPRTSLELEEHKEETETGPDRISDERSTFEFEAEQFKKMVEASRYEVMKAMSEIEKTKSSIKMAEMRLNAARKIEEAAKAVEAIAIFERKALLNGENSLKTRMYKPEEITLPFEEYNFLSYKGKHGEEMCKTKFVDTNGIHESNKTSLYSESANRGTYKKNSLEQAFDNEGGFYRREVVEDGYGGETSDYRKMQYSGHSSTTSKFRESHPFLDRKDSFLLHRNESNNIKDESSVPNYRSTISIGDVLRRKLILRDDLAVEKHVEAQSERQQVSLSQMLREQSGLILHHTKSMKDGITNRHFFTQKKKFGFIHVVLPKHKKKTHKSET